MASPSAAPNPRIHARASTRGAVKECQGKSKFFLEHQAKWEKEGNKGYDTNAHGWRFAYELTFPEGEIPSDWGYSKPLWDEHAKDEARRRHREAKQRKNEALQRQQRIEQVRTRWREKYGAGKAPRKEQLQKEAMDDMFDWQVLAEKRHTKNVQMALNIINRKHPGRNYELWEISAKSTIVEMELSYCHYNFTAYSPSSGFGFFFAETSDDVKCEDQVHSWCSIETGEIGCYVRCMSYEIYLVHPSSDKFLFGDESLHCCCADH
uniref:DUF3615 domain-containing protein n=1 Tax=Oryza glumipatula TaxID=40148 RepID=A0A0E0B9P9_9ORYZ